MRAHLLIFVVTLVPTLSILQSQQSPTSQNPSPPLSLSDVEHGLKAGVTNTRMEALVKQYRVDFELTDAVEKELRAAGANSDLLLAVSRNPPGPRKATIPSGTAVTVRLLESIDSGKNQIGDTFHAILDQPLIIDGQIVVQSGNDVRVRLAGVRNSLLLTLETLSSGSQTYHVLTDQYVEKGGSPLAEKRLTFTLQAPVTVILSASP